MRHFCTAGPVQSDIHYSLAPEKRIDLSGIMQLIEGRKYFILHAPRQTGKTSSMNGLVRVLNASGKYRAVYVNVEGAQSARDDVDAAMKAVLSALARQIEDTLGDSFAEENRSAILARSGGHDALQELLSEWCKRSPLPVCLVMDEIDAVVGDSLIAILRQLRAGYNDRPGRFPQSVILCGVRDVRDYRIHGAKEIITGGSAFNVKAESIRLPDFSRDDVRALYEQHTAETGQVFEEGVYERVWKLTRGQPWLVNALADEACFKLEEDRAKPITAALIDQAKENLIVKRVTHLDSLTDKLKEPRVRRIIQPILQGEDETGVELAYDDDAQYVMDLGLIRRGENGLEIANGIYQEVVPRQLNFLMQLGFESRERTAWYVGADGRLDMEKLMAGFQQFFRENSEIWLERYEYREAGPQLLLQAFLQRIVNGGGRIDREYALGRRRTDLLVTWNYAGGVQREVIEIKVVRGSLEKTIADGLRQTAEYLDSVGVGRGHLVIFRRDPEIPWEEKVFRREEGRVTVWGM
ncbi:MAG: ATP-binding protein [Acidobacteria bacterium]|nr:ATP-binding protein [Acidobacteriota bacterium]